VEWVACGDFVVSLHHDAAIVSDAVLVLVLVLVRADTGAL